MNSYLELLLIVILGISGGYIFGRLFTKGVFKEIDILLGKKFVEHLNKNKKKSKENGKEKTKKVQFQRENGE